MEQTVVIAGSGIMGASLAQVYAGGGWKTLVWCRSQASADRCSQLIDLNQSTMVQTGMLTQAESDDLRHRIQYSFDESVFAEPQVDLILETIVEDLAIKQEFLSRISRLASPSVLMATNTSGLSITSLAAGMSHKERFMGQHWLNPPHFSPLCELVSGAETAPQTVEKMQAIVLGLGKHPVCVRDIPGFIVNRLQYALLREALHILDIDAASVEDIDAVFKYGMGLRLAAVGQLSVVDFNGVDVFDKVTKYLFPDLDTSVSSPRLDQMVEKGYCGVKAGRGFYDYSGDKAEKAIRQRDEAYIRLAKCLYGPNKD